MTQKTTQGINWTHAEDSSLAIRVCPSCGVTYAAPERLFQNRKDQGGSWYCPNGHSLSFTKTTVTELNEKLANEKHNTEWWRQRATNADQRADTAERSRSALKGQLTKERRRVGNGVCPCCHRTFVQLQRHMQARHPDFKAAEPA